MSDERPISEIIAAILSSGTFTEGDLNRLYRVLSMSTHPDITGGDGAEFIKMQEVINEARKRIYLKSSPGQASYDPFELLTQTGYRGPLSPRLCLYQALQVYFSLGLHSYKIRSNTAFRERNTKIIQTIIHWAYEYDREFLPLFLDLNKSSAHSVQTAVEVKNYRTAKRIFIEAANRFFSWQSHGRETTARILKERFCLVIQLIERYMKTYHPMHKISQWFLKELEHEPLKLDLFE